MSICSRIIALIAIVTICLGRAQADKDTLYYEPTSTSVTTYPFSPVTTIDVCLDTGYFITLKDNVDIAVYQSSDHGSDPFTTYYGCGQIEVYTTFPAIIRASAEATSAAEGTWSATLNGSDTMTVSPGTNPIVVCVLGIDVQAHLLFSDHSQDHTTVAQITVQVIPQ